MKKIDFTALDGIELNGLLYESKDETDKIIIAVHGMTSNCFKKRDDIIANKANKNDIDYFCFNNRGSDLAKYIRRKVNGKVKKYLGGTSYEDVLESYNDIVGAIRKMQDLGYNEIYLQGHSLGSTKVVYTYEKILENNDIELLSSIKGLILLSLVDVPTVLKFYLKDNIEKYIKIAEENVEKGEDYKLMPQDSFIHPISSRTFLQYAKESDKFDFINTAKDPNLERLNNISIPIFMRWGNVQEMILQEAGQYTKKIRSIIRNEDADIDFVDGADHGYNGREDTLANQIINFITMH